MRIQILLCALAALFVPLSLAQAAEGQFDDSRRPELKMSTRDDVPYNLGNTGRFDNEVGMLLADSPWEEFYFQRLDYSALFGRLETVLTDEAYLGGHEEAHEIAEYLRQSGLFNLKGAETTYSISGEQIQMSALSTVEGLEVDSFMGRYYAIADEAPVSSRYVGSGQYLFYLALPNFYETTMLQLERAVEQRKQMNEDWPLFGMLGGADEQQLEEMLAIMRVMGVDKIIDDSLTGELALVVYQIDNIAAMQEREPQPEDFAVAAMFGLKGTEYLEKMTETYGGELGLQAGEAPAGWKVFTMRDDPSIGMFYNDEILVITPDIHDVLERVRASEGSAINAAPCQLYFDLNLGRLDSEVIVPVTDLAFAGEERDAEFDEMLKAAAFLVDKPSGDALGSLRIVASHMAGSGQRTDFSTTKSALRYAAFHLLAGFGALATNEEWLDELGIEELLDEIPNMIEGKQDSAAVPQQQR